MTAPTRPTVLFVYGTRPEAIKMAPLVLACRERDTLDVQVVVTGQHREMLAQVNDVFGIVPEYDLELFEPGQGIESIVAKTLTRLTPILAELRPAAVVVHGDTSTANAAAQAAFYAQVPVVHLEAGLRTHDLASPFPEEANRQLIGRLAALHLAPTSGNRTALLAENVNPADIVVTGNTVIDALHRVVDGLAAPELTGRRRLLITLHRRENLGERMEGIARAIASFAEAHPDVDVVMPLHLNPAVRAAVVPRVEHLDNVDLREPLDYVTFVDELRRAAVVLTDSGGLQEEAPGLGVPVLVARDTTERPEAVDAGTARLIGTDEADVLHHLTTLFDDPFAYAAMANAVNPYGDGRACARCADAIEDLLDVGRRSPDFRPRESAAA
ncbi:MAG: UDP-N-acetylglucosamine 2-epimerase (non-hydrolyzing) [Mobilicoccus sp.]|nr:UDP-N-acetylglucosamine 2-epimerase (non-hydrolyzing) [Mobilicoccus sp.]